MLNKVLKFLTVVSILVCTLCSSLFVTTVSADSQYPKEGDTFVFADRNWLIIHIDSGEYYLYAKDWMVDKNGFSHATSSYTGAQGFGTAAPYSYIGTNENGIQDQTMIRWYKNNISDSDKSYVKPFTIYAEYYDLPTGSGHPYRDNVYNAGSYLSKENNSTYTRYMYAISAEEYYTYCYGLSWFNATMGNFRYGPDGEGQYHYSIWTRTGRKCDRGTPNRPVFIREDGSLDFFEVNVKPVDTITYELVSQKVHTSDNTGANTNYFSLANNSNTIFNIAGGTPANVYDLVIQVTRNYSIGRDIKVVNNGGCFDRVMAYRAALRLDRSKVDAAGIYYSNGAWHIGGGVTPSPSEETAASYQSGTKKYSTSLQQQSYTGANRTITIYYQLTITQDDNKIQIDSNSSSTRVYSTSPGTHAVNANPQNYQGTLSYSIKSQKQGSNDVSYFNLSSSSTPTLSIAAGTPVGTYKIEINVTASGNNNYKSKTLVHTHTLEVTPAPNPVKFDDQSGEVFYRNSAQNSPEVQPAYDNVGDVTYSIVNQKDSSNADVTYFSIADNSSPNFIIAAGTPVGHYKIKLRATAAGDHNYQSGSDDMIYDLEIKQSSIPEISIYYYKGTPNSSNTHEGLYIEDDISKAKFLDTPYLIDIHAQDLPFEEGNPVFGITKLYYEISTDGGDTYGPKQVLYDGPATLDLLKYNDIKVSDIPGIYFIRITGINDVQNTGFLQDIYRVGDAPSIFAHNHYYLIDSVVNIEKIKKLATAYDMKDGNLSNKLVVKYIINNRTGEKQDTFDSSWLLDTSSDLLSYDVTYSVTNSDGKTSLSTATLTIVNSIPAAQEIKNYNIYDRFIDKDFMNSLQNNSIWKSYEDYIAALTDAIEQGTIEEVDECIINDFGEIECNKVTID